jgi:hypothetical protein
MPDENKRPSDTVRAEVRALVRKYVTRAAIIGFVAALVCHSVPPEYRVACQLVARVCTLGASG